ncbi:MAG: glutamate/tyrosine decarboxylase-like PLP-dependent enzyme [Vicingaceae bacterium]|jgi:glutamate/tyrosine decarboxylase-like PLP-dependent enzyme
MYWKSLERSVVNDRVDAALNKNTNYHKNDMLGIPGTYLDQKEFYPDASFLKDAPFLRTLIANPNHIGCHTLKKPGSPIFQGTQAIEKELISICAEEVFAAEKDIVDGYVATGGTEANLEAMWIYRNYLKKEYHAKLDQIGVLFSEDTHYSITKGCDLLQLSPFMLSVNKETRQIEKVELQDQLKAAKEKGIKYFIVILNVSTTMFGSVDDIDPITDLLEAENFIYKVHLDAAFGGFIYPFTNLDSVHNFKNEKISSVSIDGHKMLQTPYGTGIFLIRKGFMQYVTNNYAQYVPGLDYTLCGSRSGANAVVIWMQLMNYGSKGWTLKMNELIRRTDVLCEKLEALNIDFFRNPYLNIVTIKADQIPADIALKFELVADSYESRPMWWKIVVMDHVTTEILNRFLNELEGSNQT